MLLAARWKMSSSKSPEVGQQCRALFGLRLAVEVHTIGGGDRRHHSRRGQRANSLEQLDVVIDHFLERVRAVVVEVRRGVADAAQAGDIQFVPVIGWRWPADES